MIAYFDTSALVPLLIDELGTEVAGAVWDHASRLVSVRLIHVEARAALAQAARAGRITADHGHRSVAELDGLLDQFEYVEVDEALVRSAGDVAARHGLRAYDSVHLAAALGVRGADLVVVAGDGALLAAAENEGLAVTATA